MMQSDESIPLSRRTLPAAHSLERSLSVALAGDMTERLDVGGKDASVQ